MPKEIIAFLTPEMAISDDLQTYSGGLGVFGGGFALSARKYSLPMVFVTVLPREGYYDQAVDFERVCMRAEYVKRYYSHILTDIGLVFPIQIDGAEVYVKVWRLAAERYNTCPIYFLDTDIEQNDSVSRLNTLQLYGGSRASGANDARHIAQSLVLGRGGVEALRRMNYRVRLYHVNESHAAFAATEVLRSHYTSGRSTEEVIARARREIVFTTHTPVLSGNPEYDSKVVRRLGGFHGEFGDMVMRLGGNPFSMTALAMRLSSRVNAVSKKHLVVAEKMWAGIEGKPQFRHITNGTNREFWQAGKFVSANNRARLLSAKLANKLKMLDFVMAETGKGLNSDVMTIVWARRFAEYKRPKLLFRDLEWLKTQLTRQKFQVVIAGKPHPDDDEMIKAWNELYRLSRELDGLVVLAGYNLEMSKILKAGADLWLNTPRAPLEACGTSGMSAAMNGAVNMSTPDGWMCETDPKNCFLFGAQWERGDQDDYDAVELRKALETAAELFYSSPKKWCEMALRAKIEAEELWTSDRMVYDYMTRMYNAIR